MQHFLKSIFAYAYPYSVHNLQDIKNCLYANHSKGTVYAGAQARLVRLTKSAAAHRAIYDRLAEEVYQYLNNGKAETQASFDQWHHEICESFINNCASAGVIAHYGMAQKFLNLLMKYAYCFNDANTLDPSKFQYCHFILDGYTYYSPSAAYVATRTYGAYTLHTPFYCTDVVAAPGLHRTVWSKLSYNEYIRIQRDIQTYLTGNPLRYADVAALDPTRLATITPSYELTPFETEFFIW